MTGERSIRVTSVPDTRPSHDAHDCRHTDTKSAGGLRNSIALSLRLTVERGNERCMLLAVGQSNALARSGTLASHLPKAATSPGKGVGSCRQPRTFRRPRILVTPARCPAIDDNPALSLSGGLALTVAPPADNTSAGGASSRLTLAGFLNIPQPSTWRLYLIHPIRAYEVQNARADDTSPTRCLPARSASTCQVDQEAGDDTWMTRA